MPFFFASATTPASAASADVSAAATPSSRRSACTRSMQASGGVEPGSLPTTSHTCDGMNRGACGVVTCQTVPPRWADPLAARPEGDETGACPQRVYRTSVLLESYRCDTARRGEERTGS